MIKEITISDARHKLTLLPESLAKEPGSVTITRRGKPVLAIMPWEFYKSIVETLEFMGDADLMKDPSQRDSGSAGRKGRSREKIKRNP